MDSATITAFPTGLGLQPGMVHMAEVASLAGNDHSTCFVTVDSLGTNRVVVQATIDLTSSFIIAIVVAVVGIEMILGTVLFDDDEEGGNL